MFSVLWVQRYVLIEYEQGITLFFFGFFSEFMKFYPALFLSA
jgi:hypothetical protein